MPHLELHDLVLLIVLAVCSAVAAVTDLRTRRIPNKLTVPLFVAGLLYQAIFFGWGGLWQAAQGFAFAFGTFFILWLVGGGGAGDAKLVGAISVWLGLKRMIAVLSLSVGFVLVGTFAIVVYSVLTGGMDRTKKRFLSPAISQGQRGPETIEQRRGRRIMTYAFPVALATWVVLLYVHFMPAVVNP